jgi:hypothetical protein
VSQEDNFQHDSEVSLTAVKAEKLNFFDEQLLSVESPVQSTIGPAVKEASVSKTSPSAEQPVKEIKIVKKARQDHPPQLSSSALDYVRKLRKAETQPGRAAVVDPVESVGVGIMARVAAATSTLHTNIQVRERKKPRMVN